MARPPKKKSAGGRVTPKATDRDDGPHHPGSSTRYTPPVPQSEKISAPWVAPVMFALLGLGTAIIVLNYLGVLPGATDNWYLLVGLGFILGGIITATQLH
ncbi:MAG TPA: cell division protein CrgA [Acidimicrobiales bacterium]|nr:cell division protein CrgA [Acidimicrobiales bacterium]